MRIISPASVAAKQSLRRSGRLAAVSGHLSTGHSEGAGLASADFDGRDHTDASTTVSDAGSAMRSPDRAGTAALLDRSGRCHAFGDMPGRAKGGSLFSGSRSEYSRAIIAEQVEDVAAKFVRGRVDFDGDNADWMIFPAFRLPRIWRRFAVPLMIVFPRDYPTTPPIGFYMPNWLDSPNGHFYGTAYHGASDAPTLKGWNWYCCTVNDGCWRPYPARFRGEWRFGDNLWTYITLVNEVLGSPEDAD